MSAVPDQEVRRARVAVAALFFTNGAGYANLVPRLPEIKTALGLSDTLYGASIAVMPVGALLSGIAAGVLVRRFGSARVAATGTVVLAFALLGIALAPVAAIFAGALFIVGMVDSVTDVAQNAHGLRVQRRYGGRSIINGFHALWSLGAVTGGLLGAAAIGLRLPLGIHIAISGALVIATALIALRFCLPGPDEQAVLEGAGAAQEPRAGASAWPSRAVAGVLVLLALISIAAISTEDIGSSWATLYMSETLGAPGALAATGYIALIGAQFIGRVSGDALTDRLGQRAVARIGGAVIVLGMALALLLPSVPTTLVGFAAAGYGAATIIPAAMHVADELPGLRPGSGLTIVTTLMRLGLLLTPLIVGAVSDATSLATALWIVPVAGAVILLFAGSLRSRSRMP